MTPVALSAAAIALVVLIIVLLAVLVWRKMQEDKKLDESHGGPN